MTYGKSLTLTDDFDFAFDKSSRRFTTITGSDNVIQSVKIILNTFEGENKFIPNFGTRLQDLIGRKVSDNFIKYILRTAILRDERISSVDKIYIKRTSQDSVSLRIIITTNEEETLELSGGLSWRGTV